MDVHFKNDVSDVQGLQLPTIRAIVVMAGVYRDHGKTLTVTSINDGKHSANSKHYNGCAFDSRTRNNSGDLSQWPDDLKRQLAQTARNRLGSDYDVVIESTHIHTEFDPK